MKTGRETIRINLDLKGRAGVFPKYWIRCFGSECAAFMLRHDLVEHFRMARREFPVEYVRFHGILSDNVGVAHRGRNGRIGYTWFNFDRVYDNVLDLGMRPFVEYSFMPVALASGKQTIFYWSGNVTPPRNHREWEALIEAATRRLVRRYGTAEVRKWYFEIWNEPNLPPWFFSGRMKDYFRMYDHAAEAVKRVDPHLRVGGPASALAEWVGEFIEHCRRGRNAARPGRRGAPADFVSFHLYPSDPFWLATQGKDPESMGEDFFRNRIWRNREVVDRVPDMGLEVHMTEWGCSSSSRAGEHDGAAGAAFALKAIQEVAGAVDTFSWWTLSDVFCEAGLPPSPFHGGFGLLTVDGLKKPAWFAFQALQELGTDLLDAPFTTPDHSFGMIPTHCPDGTARLLAWAHQFPESPRPPVRRVELELKGFPPRAARASVEHYRIDAAHTNVRAEWVRLGQPDNLTREQLEGLRSRNRFDLLESRVLPVRGGTARYRFALPPDAVSYLVIR